MVGVDPARTRLLRHQTELLGSRTPLALWHEDRAGFEYYQSYQLPSQRAWFAADCRAAFGGTRDGRTLFLGLYEVAPPVRVDEAFTYEVTGIEYSAGSLDHFPPRHLDELMAFEGRVFVEWGGGASGKRAWRQRADAQNKPVTELHLTAAKAPFPGLMALAASGSALRTALASWREQLSAARGVYLLTCPRTGELYVGSAGRRDGFWAAG